MFWIFHHVMQIGRSFTIKTKLLCTFFILIFVPLIFLTMLSYNRISKSMEENILRSSEKSLEQSSSYMEFKLGNILNVTNIISYNKDIQSILAKNPTQYDLDPIQQHQDFYTLSSFLKTLKDNPDIFHIRLYIREFSNYSYNSPDTNFFLLKDVKEIWFQKFISSNSSLAWISPDSFKPGQYENHEPVVSVIKRIRDMQSFTSIIAILRVDLLQSTLADILDKANTTKTGLTYIINHEGDLIVSTGNKSILQNKNLGKEVESSTFNERSWRNIILDNKNYLVWRRNIANTDWQLVSVIPFSEIQEPGENVKKFMFLLMFLSGMLSYLFAYIFSNSAIKRIQLLAKSMDRVRGGELKTSVADPSKDEIGHLAHSFNYMVEEMAKMIEEKYESGKMIKSLELKSLQAQINPHFLYNSLEMINWSAAMKDIPEIVLMVQSLSKFYKIGLSKSRELITFKDELEHIQAYLNIQNLRFGDVVKMHLDIQEEVFKFSILKVTLQPIVENAILHGILQKTESRGNVYISASIHDDIIVITIKDDGIGMKQETLENILLDGSQDKYHGYGIKNINERIKIHYGSQYGLEYQSSPGTGTTVTITFPALQVECP